MKLFKRITGNRNALDIAGVHSCLLGFMGVGYRYVIYFPEKYRDMPNSFDDSVTEQLIDLMNLFKIYQSETKPAVIGFSGLCLDDKKHIRSEKGYLSPCDVVVGPVIMTARLFASIAASHGVNERPWELSDELAVSLLACGVKVQKANAYVANDGGLFPVIDSLLYDTWGWSSMRDRVRKAGG